MGRNSRSRAEGRTPCGTCFRRDRVTRCPRLSGLRHVPAISLQRFWWWRSSPSWGSTAYHIDRQWTSRHVTLLNLWPARAPRGVEPLRTRSAHPPDGAAGAGAPAGAPLHRLEEAVARRADALDRARSAGTRRVRLDRGSLRGLDAGEGSEGTGGLSAAGRSPSTLRLDLATVLDHHREGPWTGHRPGIQPGQHPGSEPGRRARPGTSHHPLHRRVDRSRPRDWTSPRPTPR